MYSPKEGSPRLLVLLLVGPRKVFDVTSAATSSMSVRHTHSGRPAINLAATVGSLPLDLSDPRPLSGPPEDTQIRTHDVASVVLEP